MKSAWLEVQVLDENFSELDGYYERVGNDEKWKKDKGSSELPDKLESIEDLFEMYMQVRIVAGQFEASDEEEEEV